MSFPLVQSVELLSLVLQGLYSDNDTQKNTACEVLHEYINLSNDALHFSNELALKFRNISQRMKDEAKLMRDAAHIQALNRMKEYENKIKEDALRAKEENEHYDTLQKMAEIAKKMKEDASKTNTLDNHSI